MEKHLCQKEGDIATLKANIKNMNEKLDDIKTIMVEFIKTAETKYSTKEEHKTNSQKIEKLEKDNLDFKIMIAKYTGGAIVISTIIGFLLNKLF